MPFATRWVGVAALAAFSTFIAAPAQARSDTVFMQQAARAGHAEIEAGKLALHRARSAEVKRFAETLVKDHTRLAAELKALALAKKVALPAEPSVKQKASLKLIHAADAARFDARYTKSFGVQAHEESIKLFEAAAKRSDDADVKAFAERTLPELHHHLEMAKGLAASPKK